MNTPDNVRTFLYNLPVDVHACTVLDGEDNWYTIFLNARDSHEQNKKSLAHELRHIENGDFDKWDVDEIEKNNHTYD